MNIRKIILPLGLVATLAAVCGSLTAADPTPPAAGDPAKVSFTIVGGDRGADVTKISVNKGDVVSITFKVDPDNTYHAGLDFRSAKVNTGAISVGDSKTVTFTAESSFEFEPYWPSSNRRKPYAIAVTVK